MVFSHLYGQVLIKIIYFCRDADDPISKLGEYNFYVNGKPLNYADRSLLFFSMDNKFRKLCVKIENNTIFNIFILLLILLNSIFLAIGDYNCVDLKSLVSINIFLFYLVSYT